MIVDDRDSLRDELLNVSQILLLLGITESDRDTARTRSTCTTDTVDIRFRNIREFEIDHVRELIDIDPTCGDISRDEYTYFFILKSRKGSLAIVLGFIAVDRLCRDTCEIQVFHDFIGSVLRSREDEDSFDSFIFEYIFEKIFFIVFVDEVDTLADHVCSTRWRSDFDFRRIGEYLMREFYDRRRHSRREEEGLPLLWKLRDDLLHIMDEPHIEHTVCLIEDEEFDTSKIDESLLHEVEKSTRSGNEDIDTFWEGIDLAMLADASEDHFRSEVRISAIVREALFDLDRELTSRSEDERADRASARDFSIFLVHKLDDRKCKWSCLPCTCLCHPEEISSRKYDRDGFLLYRCRWCIAFFGESSENRIDQMEFGEEHGNGDK